MRALIGIVATGLAAAGIGIWLNSVSNSAMEISSISKPTAQAAISIWDIHNQPHVKLLPVQQIDDQSVVFSRARR